MSGATCEECGSPYLKSIDKEDLGPEPYQCVLCGWQGDISCRPRKWLTQESNDSYSELFKRKKEGKLFYVKVYIDESLEGTDEDPTFTVLGKMKTGGCSSVGEGKDRHLLFEVEARPSDELIDNVKKIKGIRHITVF